MAYLNGAVISLDPRLSVSILQRNYERGFQNLFSNALGEGSKNTNEKGWYFGAASSINSKWAVSGYFDVFTFPWLRYNTDAPSFGHEWLAQLTFAPSKKLELYARWRKEVKQENNPGNDPGIDYTVDRVRQYLRFHAAYKLSKEFSMKSRLELSEYSIGGYSPENGYLIYQDVIYTMSKLPLTVSLRFALFDTESYNAGIYAYENDVLYAYSIPAYYYRGARTYLMLNYMIYKGFEIWLRYSQTYLDNKDVISSGLSEIQGNTKSEIKAQLSIKF